MPDLQRITTQYIEVEDRLRLTGELAPGEVVVLWLTQRLMHRLIGQITIPRQSRGFSKL